MFVPIAIGGSEPGSATYSTPGTYSFTVPEYTTLAADVSGAGGGGAVSNSSTAGTQSSFNSTVIGYGGGGGGTSTISYPVGSSGTATGGDTNTTGGGSAGGAGGSDTWNGDNFVHQGAGGPGGRAVKTYAAGALTIGATITVVVGTGGTYSGGNGSVTISWT